MTENENENEKEITDLKARVKDLEGRMNRHLQMHIDLAEDFMMGLVKRDKKDEVALD